MISKFVYALIALPVAIAACGSDKRTAQDNVPVDASCGASCDGGAQEGDGGGQGCALTCNGRSSFGAAFADGELTDAARGRTLPYRTYFPEAYSCKASVIVVSHGGNSVSNGHLQLGHLGNAYAGAGFVSVHIGHRPSTTLQQHLLDRPADVTFFLDALARKSLTLPSAFGGTLELSAVGHVGHSYGAYTAHAPAGATFTQGVFTDPRIRAIAPISPQGPGQFGAFDRAERQLVDRGVAARLQSRRRCRKGLERRRRGHLGA